MRNFRKICVVRNFEAFAVPCRFKIDKVSNRRRFLSFLVSLNKIQS